MANNGTIGWKVYGAIFGVIMLLVGTGGVWCKIDSAQIMSQVAQQRLDLHRAAIDKLEEDVKATDKKVVADEQIVQSTRDKLDAMDKKLDLAVKCAAEQDRVLVKISGDLDYIKKDIGALKQQTKLVTRPTLDDMRFSEFKEMSYDSVKQ